jgi:Outer membrane protein beta-barrel domain
MRNKILICFASLLSFMTLKGQSSFGVSAGGNLIYTSLDHDESRIAYYGGAFVRFDLSEKVYLQPEILYSRKGTGLPGYFGPFNMEIDFHYISLPALVGFRMTDNLSIDLGPEVGYLVDGAVTIDKYGPTAEEDFPSFDLGIDMGLMYRLWNHFGFRLRYHYGLTNVMDVKFFDANSQSLGGLFEGKNRVLQVGLSYFLSDTRGEKVQVEE